MKFDYNAPLSHFWETAPDKPGFKPLYAALFSALLHDLSKGGYQSIPVDYPHYRTKVGLGKEAYYAALRWLEEAGFLQYIAGTPHVPARVYVQLSEDKPNILSSDIPDATRTQPGFKPDSTRTEPGRNPDYAHTDAPASGRAEKDPVNVVVVVKGDDVVDAPEVHQLFNVTLSDPEQAELLRTFGPTVLRKGMADLSGWKQNRVAKGETVNSTDYYLLMTKWCASAAAEIEKQKLGFYDVRRSGGRTTAAPTNSHIAPAPDPSKLAKR